MRRLRIQRAQEYGALWARAWEESVTHVIVDKGLVYDDILHHLNLGSFPVSSMRMVEKREIIVLTCIKPNIALVDESYLSECIQFRSVLNPGQTRFRINGVPKSPIVEKQPAKEAEQSSSGSLPLKPPKGQGQSTPTPSEQLSGGQVQHEDQQPILPVEEVSDRERDVLDDIIDEAKVVEDLVRRHQRFNHSQLTCTATGPS